MENEKVIVIDFGGQYNQLVARRVRECNVYCEIYSYKTDLEKIRAMQPKGIILTGGIARSELFTGMVKERVSFLAPVAIYGGENEMESLALGALRVLRGEEKVQEFTKVEGRL